MSGHSLPFWRAKSRYLSESSRDFDRAVQVAPEYTKELKKNWTSLGKGDAHETNRKKYPGIFCRSCAGFGGIRRPGIRTAEDRGAYTDRAGENHGGHSAHNRGVH